MVAWWVIDQMYFTGEGPFFPNLGVLILCSLLLFCILKTSDALIRDFTDISQ